MLDLPLTGHRDNVFQQCLPVFQQLSASLPKYITDFIQSDRRVDGCVCSWNAMEWNDGLLLSYSSFQLLPLKCWGKVILSDKIIYSIL